MGLSDEARLLAEYAANQLPGGEATFSIEPGFHGQENKLVEGAQAILKSNGEHGVRLYSEEIGVIRIERASFT